MAFEPNHKKLGGRKKGTLNRKTEDLLEICERNGVNVFEAMVQLAVNARGDDVKFDRLREIAQYIYPKRKAVEHSGEIANPYLDKPLEELERLVKEKLKK